MMEWIQVSPWLPWMSHEADKIESESEPDAYDVLSPGIEGERYIQCGLLMSRSAKEEAV
jgi:hypothetical protein